MDVCNFIENSDQLEQKDDSSSGIEVNSDITTNGEFEINYLIRS